MWNVIFGLGVGVGGRGFGVVRLEHASVNGKRKENFNLRNFYFFVLFFEEEKRPKKMITFYCH